MLPQLDSEVHARAALAPADIAAMLRVFSANFYGATPAIFERDLANKDWVILLRTAATREIVGFSTLAFATLTFDQQPLSVVYSGDTIIDRPYWGTPELPRRWIKTVLEKSAPLPQPLYWLLISSGYKTYRFLTVFYKEFYPHYARPTPPALQALMHELAAQRYGTDYDAATGVVRFAEGATPLRDGVAMVDEDRLRDPHVAFFIAHNPGHLQGDELVCLTRVHPDNFTAAGNRMAR